MGFPQDSDWEDLRRMPEHPTLVKGDNQCVVYRFDNSCNKQGVEDQKMLTKLKVLRIIRLKRIESRTQCSRGKGTVFDWRENPL